MTVWNWGVQRGGRYNTIHPIVHPSLSYADAYDLFLKHLLHLEGRKLQRVVASKEVAQSEWEDTRYQSTVRDMAKLTHVRGVPGNAW